MGTGAKVVIGLGLGFLGLIIVGFASCTLCAGAAISAGVEQAEQQEAAELQANEGAEKQVPWLSQVQATCERYDAAPNDIQKSAVFQENQAFIRGKQLSGVRGTLEVASTGHGGGGLILSAKIGRSSYTESLIREGDPIYAQAANLTVGQCVQFSGTVQDTSLSGGILESMEKARICRMGYSFDFTSISACQ